MQIHISPRNLRLTGAIHAFVAEKIEHLEHMTDEIIGAHVVLIADVDKKGAEEFTVKVHLAVPGPDIHAEDVEPDLYAAIDKVYDKLTSLLRKRKTKRVISKKHKAQKNKEFRKTKGIPV
jgi:putative sigma-54 modulation protein